MLVRFAIRVARNTAISELRKSAKERPGESRDAQPTRAVEPDPMLREVIRGCRDKLPPRPAQALAQRLADPTTADHLLAERLGMVKNTFLQNITRARKLLAACLERAGVALEEVLL
jgi:RNA polymerase sigma-70 factor (ECF subfamily)